MLLGYSLITEEHPPQRLLDNAQRAEKVGFDFAFISDHFHPWLDVQGHSPFVWNILGALSQVTKTLRLGTAVTCPTVRMHPALVAQAAATSAALLEGRFFLGLGSGEALNEHILGDHWPPAPRRLEMLREAVEVIRSLFQGDEVTHYGEFYKVENARLYTLPQTLPEIYLAAGGEKAARLAGEVGDGLITTAPDEEVSRAFADAGGEGCPRYGQLTVCYHKSKAEAIDLVHRQWPNTGLRGELNVLLPTPTHFAQACKMVSREDIEKQVVCGSDPDEYLEGIREFQKAGFNGVSVHQVGAEQEPFFEFFEKRIIPKL